MTGSPHQGIETMMHPGSNLAASSKVHAALHGVPPQTGGPFDTGFGATGLHTGPVPGGNS